jgi:hypothetical protein
MNMDIPFIYEIRVEGHLPDHWSRWFEGLAICNQPNGESVLSGKLIDQAALFGVLARIHDLNLILISVARSSAAETMEPSKQQPGKN